MLNKLVVTNFPVLKYSVTGRCGKTAPFRTLFWPKYSWLEVFDQNPVNIFSTAPVFLFSRK